MKQIITTAVVAVAVALPGAAALAQQKMDEMRGMDMGKKPTANAQAVHKTKATVKKVDAKAGSVTLAHEPVASLNWPAMTMGFKVKDSALMNKLAEGKRVEVEFVQDGKDYVIHVGSVGCLARERAQRLRVTCFAAIGHRTSFRLQAGLDAERLIV